MSPTERKSLTRDEISLLLYLETCAVDHYGMSLLEALRNRWQDWDLGS